MLTMMKYIFTSLYKTSTALYNQKRLVEFYVPNLEVGDLLKKIELFNFIKIIVIFYSVMSIMRLSLMFFPYVKNYTSTLILILELIDFFTYLSIAILLTIYSDPMELKTKIHKQEPYVEEIPSILIIQNPPIIGKDGKWKPSISLASLPNSKHGFDAKPEENISQED